MAKPNVLQEFLVSIGFDISDQQMKKFNAFLDKITESFKVLAVEGGAAAIALAAEIVNLADEMDNLYFVSQRTGASAGGIKAFQFGAKQVGVTAEAATASLENFAQAMRTNPGLKGQLANFGINPDQKDAMKTYMQFINVLRRMPHYQAAQYAAQYGIDEVTLTQLTKNYDELTAAMERNKKQNADAGIDMQKLTDVSHAFSNRLRALESRWGTIALVILKDFLPVANKVLDWLEIGTDWVLKMDKATDGWSTRLLAVLGILTGISTVFKSLSILRGLLGVGGLAGGGAGGVAGGVGAAGIGIGGIITAVLASVAIIVAAVAAAYLLYKNKDAVEAYGKKELGKFGGAGFVGKGVYFNSVADLVKHFEGHTKGYGVYKDQAGIETVGFGHRVRPGESFSKDFGLVDATKLLAKDLAETARVINMSVTRSMTPGQFKALSDFEFNVGEKAFESSTLLKKFNAGDDAGAAAEFAKWDKIHRNGTLVSSAGLSQRRAAEAAQFSGGDKAVTVSQKTDIHVSTTGDAKSTAAAVAKEQARVNGDMIRNMQGATQ